MSTHPTQARAPRRLWWALSALAAVACTGPGQPTPVSGTSAGSASGDGAAPVWQVRGPGGLAAIEPGTRDSALLSAQACSDCHEAQHRDWAQSRHALAWTNGIFQSEYRRKPRRWCVHCHAPLAPQVDEVEAEADGGALAEQGVSCAACHVRAGRILARSHHPDSPHDTQVAADFGGPSFCADCHQFSFPVFALDGHAERSTDFPMQATVSQFLAARRAGKVPWPAEATGPAEARDCRTCHARGEAGHAYQGAHEPAMLERALATSVCRDDQVIVVTVENRGAGHNVPTGDIHRHLVVRVWRSTAPEHLFEAFLGRRFEPDPSGGKRTTWDSTLAPAERRRYRVPVADLGGEPDEPVAIEARYVYVLDEHPRRSPGEPTYRVLYERRAPIEELSPCAP
ncbi:multiheme c-type cytochrome [Haliangium sp.]|uniref:multiheme c-type cytochrome n=1 Tax=Haliangium sp. TaxID=2663208 RepID=UPI003D0BA0E1